MIQTHIPVMWVCVVFLLFFFCDKSGNPSGNVWDGWLKRHDLGSEYWQNLQQRSKHFTLVHSLWQGALRDGKEEEEKEEGRKQEAQNRRGNNFPFPERQGENETHYWRRIQVSNAQLRPDIMPSNRKIIMRYWCWLNARLYTPMTN